MHKRLNYLYHRYLNKTCTDQELQEFLSLIEKDELEEHVNNLFDETFDEVSEIVMSPTQKQDVFYRIREENINKSKRFAARRRMRYISSVAVLFLLLGSVYLWTQRTSNIEGKLVTANYGDNNFGKRTVILPDSSIVVLNRNAHLTYSSNFGKDDRIVNLFGEAYFSVSHNPKLPFRVETTSGISTRVLGTRFNVNALSQEQVEITVAEGRVQVESNNIVIRILKANEQLSYSIPSQKIDSKQVDASRVVSWQNKDLYFNNLSMEEVASTLEQKYNVKIKFKDPELNKVRLSATFLNDESLNEVLNVISTFLETKFQVEKNGDVIIYK